MEENVKIGSQEGVCDECEKTIPERDIKGGGILCNSCVLAAIVK